MITRYQYFKIIIISFAVLNIFNNIYFGDSPDKRSLIKLAQNFKNGLPQTLTQCEYEWEYLNKDVFFRKNLAIYYLDLNETRLHFVRNKNTNYTYKIVVNIVFNNKIVNYDVPKINFFRLDAASAYSTERLGFKFNVNQFIRINH